MQTEKNIIEILREIRPESDFIQSPDFMVDGLLDSFDVVALVTTLERRFNLNIDGLDIVPENFKNVGAIALLLRRYGINA